MADELTVAAFGLRDKDNRRTRDASLADIERGDVSAAFTAHGTITVNAFRFKIHGPDGVHLAPIQKANLYDGTNPPMVFIEYRIPATAASVAGLYRLTVHQMDSYESECETGRELLSVAFQVINE